MGARPTGNGTGNQSDPGGTDTTGDPSHPGDEGGTGTDASGAVDTSGPSSVPLPLLILGGLALLLLAAGGVGYLSRRAQSRREGGTARPRLSRRTLT